MLVFFRPIEEDEDLLEFYYKLEDHFRTLFECKNLNKRLLDTKLKQGLDKKEFPDLVEGYIARKLCEQFSDSD